MNDREPLEEWLVLTEVPPRQQIITRRQAEAHTGLERLAQFLNTPSTKRRDMADVGLYRFGGVGFDPADLSDAQELYWRVCATGGKGNQLVQESLLELIALTCDPVSVPFWLDVLNLRRPHDTFIARRRTLALAALALLAVRRNVPEAHTALRQAMHHAHADIRARAVLYLGQVYSHNELALPADVQDELRQIAVQDADFGPRFQARAVLREADLPVPKDNPGGVYAFCIRPVWDTSVSRTVELESDQTLDDLHAAIQRSIHWDSDHLYSFFMNGVLDDWQYAFACPMEDDHPPWTDEAILGELGLMLNHRFLYLFDYGDDNKFEIEVVGVYPQARTDVTYPRLIASQGKAPSQYGDWSGEG